MFNVIFIKGIISDININEEIKRSLAYETLTQDTLLYCFNLMPFQLSLIEEELRKSDEIFVSPNTYHFAYKKRFYFNKDDLSIDTQETNVPLFQNLQLFKVKFMTFFECKHYWQKIREIIYFNTIDELKNELIEKYEIKKVIPFYYSNRLLKEYITENSIKLKDITILYILEHKAIEGRKR